MTLRSKHLSALPTNVANHRDVLYTFGDATIQASQLEKSENRQRFKLVGLNHEIEYWESPHCACPPLGDEWEREYDPADLFESEKWITSIWEPVRDAFFVQKSPMQPPTMQFMMLEKASPPDAEMVVLIGLHQKLGGPFKLVYIFRRLRCVNVFEIVSQGREWWFTMHLTTDYRYGLTELDVTDSYRKDSLGNLSCKSKFPNWWIRGAGSGYPCGLNTHLVNDFESRSASSVLIIRDPQHHKNLSGGKETFVPPRLLLGAIPDALLDAYDFWQDESIVPTDATEEDIRNANEFGYKMLRGYPKDEDEETLLFVEIKFTGSFVDFSPASAHGVNSSKSIQLTGFPGRTVSLVRRPKKLVALEFEIFSRVANKIESFDLVQPPDKKKQKKKKVDSSKKKIFVVDLPIECDFAKNGSYQFGTILRVNDNGTYDVEFTGEHKWLGIQKNINSEYIRKRGEGSKKGDRLRWEDMSDDENAVWADHTDDEGEDEDEESGLKKSRLTFEHFKQLGKLLEVVRYDEDLLFMALGRIARVPGVNKISDFDKLVQQVAEVDLVVSEVASVKIPEPFDKDDMILINLLYVPRRSRLYSLVQSLTRIEVLGHICAWTKLGNSGIGRSSSYEGLQFGCPPLDAVELPRLKLVFTARMDHEGVLRLYSVDHVDLYITTDKSDMTKKMLSGISHSLLMTNVRGEMQVLVPVVPPYRPMIEYEPFSTFTVLKHSDVEKLAERFFLYPVHVSCSFLLTKGLNSAVYLMLLRFMHRDYVDVYRLVDSIATDTKFNDEGLHIFKAFGRVNDDYHPDAHACRLKIALVILDSGVPLPWDLTVECARYAVKVDRVSTSCRLFPQEECQLLDCDKVATSDTSPAYKKEIHSEYDMSLCYNRQQLLRALLQHGTKTSSASLDVSCRAPSRYLSSNWPYYQDNTVFGENYAKMVEITSISSGEDSWQQQYSGFVGDVDTPPNGWLVVAWFHTLWSSNCIKLLPSVSEIVPLYQESVTFVSVRADGQDISSLSKKYKILHFPTIVIFRGGKEVERIEGHERSVERLIRSLGMLITPEDKMAHMKRRHRIRLEKVLEAGGSPDDLLPESEEKIQGQVEWTWDPENASKFMNIQQDGMNVILKEENDLSERIVWEYTKRSNVWIPLPQDVQAKFEKGYRSGKLYQRGYIDYKSYQVSLGRIEIGSYMINGFEGYVDGRYCNMRRDGDRRPVPGEEEYLSEEQKSRDKRSAEWREKWEDQKRKAQQERIGRDVESIRGSTAFVQNSGIHYWSLRWDHIPGREGTSDAFGICSDLFETFGPGIAPIIGNSADSASSIALHSNGELYHNGNLLFVAPPFIAQPEAPTTEVHGESKEEVSDSQIPERSEETPSTAESTELKSQNTIYSSNGKVLLFGKGSIVKCELNTDLNGGTLSFYIDGKKLDYEVKGVYSLLGGSEIFPVVSMCPLDPVIDVPLAPIDEKKSVKEKKDKTDGEEDDDEDNDDDENESEDDENKEKSEDSDDEESDETVPSITLLPHDDVVVPQLGVASPELSSAVPDVGVSQKEEVVKEKHDGRDDEAESQDEAEDETEAEPKIATSEPIVIESSSEENVRWMYENENGWNVYPETVSNDIEKAKKDGKNEYSVSMGSLTHKCFIDKMTLDIVEDSGNSNSKRLRRHILSKGLNNLWELLSMKFERPFGLFGSANVQILEKIRSLDETMSGQQAGLGFLFLYSLISGDMKVKILGNSGGGYGKGVGSYDVMPYSYSAFTAQEKTSNNDSHRFALLLAQFYADRHSKSLPGSIINVLCRNRQVSLRMPKFKDTRKSSTSPIFNGWIDDSDPRSPLSELFGKVVPMMRTLKRKGLFRFPPPPPYSELPPIPPIVQVPCPSMCPEKEHPAVYFVRPELTDYGCATRTLNTIDKVSVSELIVKCQHRLGKDILKPEPPMRIEVQFFFLDLYVILT